MDAVVGPLGAVDFVTHANYVTETTSASTALNAQLVDHNLAPHHSQGWDPTVFSSPNLDTPSVHSLACIYISSSASLSLPQLCFSDVGVLQQQGLPVKAPNVLFSLPSPGISSCPVAICPLKPVPQLTPICVDRLQHKLCHHPSLDRVAYDCGSRSTSWFSPRV